MKAEPLPSPILSISTHAGALSFTVGGLPFIKVMDGRGGKAYLARILSTTKKTFSNGLEISSNGFMPT